MADHLARRAVRSVTAVPPEGAWCGAVRALLPLRVPWAGSTTRVRRRSHTYGATGARFGRRGWRRDVGMSGNLRVDSADVGTRGEGTRQPGRVKRQGSERQANRHPACAGSRSRALSPASSTRVGSRVLDRAHLRVVERTLPPRRPRRAIGRVWPSGRREAHPVWVGLEPEILGAGEQVLSRPQRSVERRLT